MGHSILQHREHYLMKKHSIKYNQCKATFWNHLQNEFALAPAKEAEMLECQKQAQNLAHPRKLSAKVPETRHPLGMHHGARLDLLVPLLDQPLVWSLVVELGQGKGHKVQTSTRSCRRDPHPMVYKAKVVVNSTWSERLWRNKRICRWASKAMNQIVITKCL